MTGPSARAPLATLATFATLISLVASACVDADGEGEGEGEGAPLGDGVLVAEPASCALGPVAVGTVASCDVTLRNRGDGPLRIVALLVDGSPSPVNVDTALLPGAVDALVVPLSVTPAVAGAGAVVFTFVSDAAPLDVQVGFVGVCSPTAVIDVSIAGAPATAPFSAALSDSVVLDASASLPCPGRTIARAQWAVAARPAAATTTLASPTALQTAIVEPFPGALAATLLVVDDIGAFSVNQATVTVRYLPRLALAVDDALLLGLEPHLFRDVGGTGERCSALDCFDGGGCGFLAASPPAWDGVAGRSPGDPLFEEAAGVSVAFPVDGAYLSGVFLRGDQAATAVATLTIDGSAPATSTRSLVPGDFWTLARVTFVVGSAPVVDSVDTIEAGVSCP